MENEKAQYPKDKVHVKKENDSPVAGSVESGKKKGEEEGDYEATLKDERFKDLYKVITESLKEYEHTRAPMSREYLDSVGTDVAELKVFMKELRKEMEEKGIWQSGRGGGSRRKNTSDRSTAKEFGEKVIKNVNFRKTLPVLLDVCNSIVDLYYLLQHERGEAMEPQPQLRLFGGKAESVMRENLTGIMQHCSETGYLEEDPNRGTLLCEEKLSNWFERCEYMKYMAERYISESRSGIVGGEEKRRTTALFNCNFKDLFEEHFQNISNAKGYFRGLSCDYQGLLHRRNKSLLCTECEEKPTPDALYTLFAMEIVSSIPFELLPGEDEVDLHPCLMALQKTFPNVGPELAVLLFGYSEDKNVISLEETISWMKEKDSMQETFRRALEGGAKRRKSKVRGEEDPEDLNDGRCRMLQALFMMTKVCIIFGRFWRDHSKLDRKVNVLNSKNQELYYQARQIVRSFMEDTTVTGAYHESVLNYEADTNTSLMWVQHMAEMLPVSCLIQVFACRVGEKNGARRRNKDDACEREEEEKDGKVGRTVKRRQSGGMAPRIQLSSPGYQPVQDGKKKKKKKRKSVT